MEYKKTKFGYLVRLLRGEEVISSLTSLAEKEKIQSGFLFGLGAVANPKLGYYDMKTKEYQSETFEGEFEIVNLTGNISQLDGKPFIHAHMTISDEECRAFGGHLCRSDRGENYRPGTQRRTLPKTSAYRGGPLQPYPYRLCPGIHSFVWPIWQISPA